MADIDKLLEEVRSLSTGDLLRLRHAIDAKLTGSHRTSPANSSERLQSLSRLRSQLVSLPIHNPADGLSNRDCDQLLYGEGS